MPAVHEILQATVNKNTCQHFLRKECFWVFFRSTHFTTSLISGASWMTSMHRQVSKADLAWSFTCFLYPSPLHTNTPWNDSINLFLPIQHEGEWSVSFCVSKRKKTIPEGTAGMNPREGILINMQGNPTIHSDSHPEAATQTITPWREAPYNLKTRSS